MVPFLILAAILGEPESSHEIETKSVAIALIDDIEIAAQEAGLLRQSNLREGQEIQMGELLAELDSSEAEMQLRLLERELEIAVAESRNRVRVEVARKAWDVAKAELQRAIESNETFDGTVSGTEMDRLKLTCDKLELEVKQAEHEMQIQELKVGLKKAEIDAAQLRIERRRIVASKNGLVVHVDRQTGEWVQPGQTICRVIGLDRIRAEGYVNIEEGLVRPGQRVRVVGKIGSENHEFSGRVTFVNPEIEPITRQYSVWAEVDNFEGLLRPGQQVRMWIEPTVREALNVNE